MRPCQKCQAAIDEYHLDKYLEPLRDLTVDHFNICSDCATIVADACIACGGAVYVPETTTQTPDYCPACRADHIKRTGNDPGWFSTPASS